ncbi:hypothetical protein [Arboricoccus pini]|nr:hypothetical protein [Arboricoccus pini]
MDWTDRLAPKPPRRRYPFWARRDRRRTAQAMAAGRSAEEMALVNRVPVMEVEKLLRDEEFQELLRHYSAVASLPYEERIARLAPLALSILEMGLETGDMRVAMFVLHEQHRGRDPARSMAERFVARAEAAARETQPRPERRLPVPPAEPRQPPGDWSHCAAIPEHQEEAEALALADLRRVARDNRAELNRLADKLASEAERMGTGLGPNALPSLRLEAVARGVARYWHERPAESMQAAIRLQGARKIGRYGTGPPS